MNATADLAALITQPFELLQELERRSRAALAGKGSGALPAEWVGIGFRIGQEQFSLPFGEESDGTQRLLHLLPALYHLKTACKVFVIDELDRSLHPLLTHSILDFFVTSCPGACQQLIVTSHETHLLDQNLLRRDEIWFAEKDEMQQTKLFSLADLGVRKDLRLERGYLQGRFGGVPFIHGMDRIRDLINCPSDE